MVESYTGITTFTRPFLSSTKQNSMASSSSIGRIEFSSRAQAPKSFSGATRAVLRAKCLPAVVRHRPFASQGSQTVFHSLTPGSRCTRRRLFLPGNQCQFAFDFILYHITVVSSSITHRNCGAPTVGVLPAICDIEQCFERIPTVVTGILVASSVKVGSTSDRQVSTRMISSPFNWRNVRTIC